MIAPAPAQTPSTAATIGCGQARIAFTSSPVMRVKSSRLRRVHLDQRPDDLEHVAAGAEIAAGAGDDERLDVLILGRGAEEIDELGIALEGQRILLLRPVERQRRDLAVDREPDMLRLVAGERQRDGIGGGHRLPPLPIGLARRGLGLGEQAHQRLDLVGGQVRRTSRAIQSSCVARHGAEDAAALGGEADDLRAPVVAAMARVDQALLDQPVDQAGDVAVRHHHALRQFAERHAVRRAVELRHQVEARQRDVELSRRRRRTSLSISVVQVSSRSHSRSSVLVVVRPLGDLGLGIERDARRVCPSRSLRPRPRASCRSRRPRPASTEEHGGGDLLGPDQAAERAVLRVARRARRRVRGRSWRRSASTLPRTRSVSV